MCKVAWSFLGLVPSGGMSAVGSDPGLAAWCPWTADVEGTVQKLVKDAPGRGIVQGPWFGQPPDLAALSVRA